MSFNNELHFLSNHFSETSKKTLLELALRKESEIFEKIKEIFSSGEMEERFPEIIELYAFYDVIKTEINL